MSKKFLILDLANLFFRCYKVSRGDPFSKAAIAVHTTLTSIRKTWREFNPDHLVIATEGGSWRYGVYPKYKANRKLKALMRTKKEVEEDEVAFQYLSELIEFFQQSTNVTCLNVPNAEGDDCIKGWIDYHPNDSHIILSTDNDFLQLLNDNVILYDGMSKTLYTTDAVYNEDYDPVSFNVTSNGRIKRNDVLTESCMFDMDDEWWRKALFIKIVRGDSGDGVFSAFPRVSINKIIAAWEDRDDQGFHWNNFMMQEWKEPDDNGNEVNVSVKDKFKINQMLIDLDYQPDEIKEKLKEAIELEINKPRVHSLGFKFIKFCSKQDLPRISQDANYHAQYLNAAYPYKK